MVVPATPTHDRPMQSVFPVRDGDRPAVRAFLTRLSPETRRARYLGPVQFEDHALEREVRRLQGTDTRVHPVLIARDGDEVRGIGEYVVDAADQGRAELALVVEDAFQRRGLGTLLFLNLEEHALQRGIRAFTGEVGNDNYRVLALLRKARRTLRIEAAYASSYFELNLRECSQSVAA